MLATGLLTLYQLTADDAWLAAATDLLDTALAHFADRDRPGRWFDSADDAEQLMLRPADPMDGATPSGASLDRRSAADWRRIWSARSAPTATGRRRPTTLQAHSPLLARAAALGRPLAGGRRIRGARAVADRGGL